MKGKRLKIFAFIIILFMVFPALSSSIYAQGNEAISSQSVMYPAMFSGSKEITLTKGFNEQLSALGTDLYWFTQKPCANSVTPKGVYLAKHTVHDSVIIENDWPSSDFKNVIVKPSESIVFEDFETCNMDYAVVLTVGESYSNPAVSSDDNQIRYSSYNPNVASVNSQGTVTALSEGMTRIYAQDTNGTESGYYVYVREKADTSVFLSSKTITVSSGCRANNYLIKVSDSRSGIQYNTLTSSDPEVAEVYDSSNSSDPEFCIGMLRIHANQIGTTTINAQTSDGTNHNFTVNVVDSVRSLTLNQSEISLSAGETTLLYATNTESPVCFMSSDDSIVQVDDNGKVHGISQGSATIFAYLDNGVTAECEVTVNYAPAASVTLSETSITVDRGDEKNLTATVKPFGSSQEVTWTSSDPSIATVTDGVIKGIKEGKTTVTVKDTAGHTASCLVTVRIPQANYIYIEVPSKTVDVGSMIQFTASVFPVGADQSVTWRSSSPDIAEISSNGTVTGKKKGITVISATSSDGKVSSNSITVTVNREIGEVQPIYRLYLPLTGEHLYTPDYNEYQTLYKKYGWGQEGIAWYSPVSTGDPVYRLYQPDLKNHLYTTDKNEVKVLTTKAGWKTDNNGKALFYSGGDVSILRVYNCGLNGMHHLSTNQDECNTLVEKYGWMHEGIKLYAEIVGKPYDKTDYYNK